MLNQNLKKEGMRIMLISGPGKIANIADSLDVGAKESAKGALVATTNEKDSFVSFFDRGLNMQKTEIIISPSTI